METKESLVRARIGMYAGKRLMLIRKLRWRKNSHCSQRKAIRTLKKKAVK
jgi:hypothetical protein